MFASLGGKYDTVASCSPVSIESRIGGRGPENIRCSVYHCCRVALLDDLQFD